MEDTRRIDVLEERLRNMDMALAIQAREYHRRLNELNHAHDQAVAVQHTYVTRDFFDAAAADIKRTRDAAIEANDTRHAAMRTEFQARFSRIESFQSKIIGAIAIVTFVMPIATGMIVYVLTH